MKQYYSDEFTCMFRLSTCRCSNSLKLYAPLIFFKLNVQCTCIFSNPIMPE